jgi:hypothetical protein
VVVVKGNIGYAGGARRLVLAAAVVAASLGLWFALEHGLGARAGSLTAAHPGGPATTLGDPRPTGQADPTGSGGQPPGTSSATVTAALGIPLAPPIVTDHVTFGAARKAETAAYAQRHYGTRTGRLDPTMIVLHYTESDTYASARSLFEADLPNRGERPGTCAHYVVDQDGTIYELVPPTVMCRHAIGLNHRAIGIEFVQSSNGRDSRWAVQQVLRRKTQAAAGVALVEDLQRRFAIKDGDVIGHAMVNDAKGFRDLRGWRNDHTEWQQSEVARFRSMLTTEP